MYLRQRKVGIIPLTCVNVAGQVRAVVCRWAPSRVGVRSNEQSNRYTGKAEGQSSLAVRLPERRFRVSPLSMEAGRSVGDRLHVATAVLAEARRFSFLLALVFFVLVLPDGVS
jgi:hypothetical protein